MVLDGDELLTSHSDCFTLGKKLAFIEQKAGWAPEPVWTLWRRQNLLSLPGFKPQTFQPLA